MGNKPRPWWHKPLALATAAWFLVCGYTPWAWDAKSWSNPWTRAAVFYCCMGAYAWTVWILLKEEDPARPLKAPGAEDP